MWILSKMRIWKCEFCQKWDFEHVNFWINWGFLPQCGALTLSNKCAFFLSPSKQNQLFSKLLSLTWQASVASHVKTKMFPRPFHWVMLALSTVSAISNTCSLKCVLDTFDTDVTLFRILALEGIISTVFSIVSAIINGLSALGVLGEGKLKCSFILGTSMPPYIIGILCSMMISVIR